MEKTFDPAAVEGRISAAWEAAGAFRAGRPERAGAEPYCIVIPPPNVTGNLHMGHALNNTLQDILCRYWRMKGRDVLWQPGTDHAGIATQMVVERQLAERQQPDRRSMGREAFLKRVWEWKAESGGAIVNQLKRLGASCDWSRERFTMDEGLSRAVAKVFVQLHREGLIYKDKRLVNWDPTFQSAISDLEVQQIEYRGAFAWSREQGLPFEAEALTKALSRNPNGHLYYFDYPLVDDSGAPTGGHLTVATTRPETMLGDSGVAVHPDDPRYAGLHGRLVRLPLVGRLIKIVADDYSDPEKGTGAVKITPAHDFNDFDVGRRHSLPLINILDAGAALALRNNEAFTEGVAPSADFEEVLSLDGVDRFAARARVVAMMAARGLLAKIEPHTHAVPHGDRSGSVVEPWLTDQWYVDAKTLAAPALEAVRDGRTTFTPRNWEKTYFDWLENIEPWCISRQLWWGHQIPAWYSPWGGVHVAETEDEACAAALAEGVERGALTEKEAAAIAADPARLAATFTRDEDVLDTWFSSALWPFSTLGWPDETPELARFYPTSTLVTGFDIIFFWVARMMMMGLHFRDDAPFRDVYIHALVRDEKGAKMSKSKGNVIDPLDLIDRFGADALRFTLAAMAAQGRDVKLATSRVEGYRNFATKLWNAARFAEMNGCAPDPAFDPAAVREPLNRWALGQAAFAIAETSAAIEGFRFNDAANSAYRFVWNVFCDWHLELAKPVLLGEDTPARRETRATTAFVLREILKLMHPFMPFLTEEIWALSGQSASMLALTPWPDLSRPDDSAAEAEIGWVIDLVSEIRSVRSEMGVPAGARLPLTLIGATPDIAARADSWGAVIANLARLSGIDFGDSVPPGSAQIIARGAVAALPLKGVVDVEAERLRLQRELDNLIKENVKIDARLANADFIARAKEEVIEDNRERREANAALIAKVGLALNRLREI
jgi:valyl-tRNA synthetase